MYNMHTGETITDKNKIRQVYKIHNREVYRYSNKRGKDWNLQNVMNCMGHADKVDSNNFSIKILESIKIKKRDSMDRGDQYKYNRYILEFNARSRQLEK